MYFQLPAGTFWKAPSGRGTQSYTALIRTVGGCSASLIGPTDCADERERDVKDLTGPAPPILVLCFRVGGEAQQMGRTGMQAGPVAGVLSCPCPAFREVLLPSAMVESGVHPNPNLDHLISLLSCR